MENLEKLVESPKHGCTRFYSSKRQRELHMTGYLPNSLFFSLTLHRNVVEFNIQNTVEYRKLPLMCPPPPSLISPPPVIGPSKGKQKNASAYKPPPPPLDISLPLA